jgi:hypothetical protein
MPTHRRINAQIDLGQQPPTGLYANAFRVLEEGSRCVLEFLVFSGVEQKAYSVCRVRLRPEFVPIVRDHLQRTLNGSTPPTVVGAH